MKKHLEKNWGWYAVAAFQLLLVIVKLVGFFPYITWVGILLPAFIVIIFFAIFGAFIWFVLKEPEN